MKPNHQEVHLLVDRGGPGIGTRAPDAMSPGGQCRAVALHLPRRPSRLVARADHPPRLVSLNSSEATPDSPILEPVVQGRHPALLVRSEGDPGLRVNGLPVPLFAVLKEGDYLRLGLGTGFYVTVYNHPRLGEVPPSLIGKECPVCRVPFGEGVTCYVCSCGAAVHHSPEAGDESLQCAKLRARSGCPACQRPVILEAGYTFIPDPHDE
jgi:hypothetical protein